MSTKITDTTMRSDTGYAAQKVADSGEAWVVSWLPDRQLDRNQAVTAMTLAEYVATYWNGHRTVGIDRRRFHAFVQVWADELEVPKREVMQRLAGKTGGPRPAQ